MITEKERTWQSLSSRVATITDSVGCPIDAGILETVIALQAIGINTIASCDGHLDQSSAPWIDIGASGVRHLEKAAFRKQLLLEQADSHEEQCRLVAEREQAKLVVKRLHLVERQKLVFYLERFYRDRQISYECRLILNPSDWLGTIRLESQGATSQECLPVEEQAQKLLVYQQEMQAFTAFLKQCYFQS